MPRKPTAGVVTLSAVAQAAGVSLATASRAINGSLTRKVGDELSAHVRLVAAQLGYAPDANAQAIARGATRTLGVAVNDLTDPYFAAIANGMMEASHERDLLLTLASAGNRAERLVEVVRALDSLRVRAILLVGGRLRDEAWRDHLIEAIGRYRGRGGRVVTVGLDLPGLDRVLIDNAGGSERLAEELFRLGYRRPILLAGPELHSTAKIRTEAFRSRFRELGGRIPKANVISCDFTHEGGQEALRLAVDHGTTGDVVVASNDVVALGAMNAARAAGIRIGVDLGFAGFGDITSLRDVEPGLTTVHVPAGDVGAHAVELAVSGPGDGTGTVRIPVHVVVRASAPARSGPTG